MKILLNSQNFELSDTSFTFLEKYLERMKNFIEKNSIEIEVYEDIEERIAEIFSDEKSDKVSDKIVINIVNEIWEPDEIFSELIEETNTNHEYSQSDSNNIFSNNWEEFTRDSKEWIFFGVCYGISQRYKLDPLFVRLFFICGTFLWGFTLLLYVALIFLLPNRPSKKKEHLISDKAIEFKDSMINQAKKAWKKLEKKDLENFKDTIVTKAKYLWDKIDIQKIKNKLSPSYNSDKSVHNETESSRSKDLQNWTKKNEEITENIKTYSLNSHWDQIKEKIVYREVKANFIVRFFRFILSIIKNIILFIFHSGRYFLAFIILISAIPVLISVLFTSGLIFSDFTINNQVLFNQVDFFLKIGIVWLLFSIFFGIFGIFLKLLAGKTVANIFMINGLIGIFIFAFIGGLGFFTTANKFTNTYSNTQVINLETNDLHISESKSFANNDGINWLNDIEFIQTNNKNITIEIISTINRSTQIEADSIFWELNTIESNESNQLDLSIYKNVSFSSSVPYSFLRKDIKIYLPKGANITFGYLHGNNIKDISNLYYINNWWDYNKVWWIEQCSNKNLVFNIEKSAYICTNISIENSSDTILEEIDIIIEKEIRKVDKQ
jgi:phage shock protein PspC (stress-responsive transcriptional regulator)